MNSWLIMLVLTAATTALTMVIVKSQLFAPVRSRIHAKWPDSMVSHLFDCVFCMNFWSAALVLAPFWSTTHFAGLAIFWLALASLSTLLAGFLMRFVFTAEHEKHQLRELLKKALSEKQ